MRIPHPRARALIQERGFRYDRVAAKLGLTPDRFNHILEGRRPVPEPVQEFYRKLGEALFCDPSEVREPENGTAAA